MRIVIAKKLLSTVGGSEAQARALGAALRDRGHEVTLVGLRPRHRRAGMPARIYDAPAGDVVFEEQGLTYRFIASPGALVEGLIPVSLVGAERLRGAIAGTDVVHCLAREWAGPYERGLGPASASSSSGCPGTAIVPQQCPLGSGSAPWVFRPRPAFGLARPRQER